MTVSYSGYKKGEKRKVKFRPSGALMNFFERAELSL